jgi:hypothetical protein
MLKQQAPPSMVTQAGSAHHCRSHNPALGCPPFPVRTGAARSLDQIMSIDEQANVLVAPDLARGGFLRLPDEDALRDPEAPLAC